MSLSMNLANKVAGQSLHDRRRLPRWAVPFQTWSHWLQRRLSAHPASGCVAPHPEARRQVVVRGQSVSLTRPRGHRIACEAGVLWLTFDGERRDIVLEVGQSHVCDSDGRLIVHALAAGAFRVG